MMENKDKNNHINNKTVIRTDKDGNEVVYNSVTEAAMDINVHPGQIARSFRTNTSVKGYLFTYPKDYNERIKANNEGKDKSFLVKAKQCYDRPPFYMKGKMTEGKKEMIPISNMDLDKLLKSISNAENN